MAKYIKLEDAINVLYSGFVTKSVIEGKLKDLPTIDIVRCEDCVWRDKDKQGENYCTYAKGLADIGEESFCSWGERKDDE